MKNSITELPDEIMLMFLRYLSIKELVVMSAVSKTFEKLSFDNSLWKPFIQPTLAELCTVNVSPSFFKEKLKEYVSSLIPVLRPKVISQVLSYHDAERITKIINTAIETKAISLGFFQPHGGDIVTGFKEGTVNEFYFSTRMFSVFDDKATLAEKPLVYLLLTNKAAQLIELCKSRPHSIIFVVTNQPDLAEVTENYQGLIKCYHVTDFSIRESIHLSLIHSLIIEDLKKWTTNLPPLLLQSIKLSEQVQELRSKDNSWNEYHPVM